MRNGDADVILPADFDPEEHLAKLSKEQAREEEHPAALDFVPAARPKEEDTGIVKHICKSLSNCFCYQGLDSQERGGQRKA